MAGTELLTDKALKIHLGILYHGLRDTEDAGIAFTTIKKHIEAQAREIERLNLYLQDVADAQADKEECDKLLGAYMGLLSRGPAE